MGGTRSSRVSHLHMQVVEIGGNQLFVEEGKWYNVNRLNAEVGSQIKLGRVLALKEQGKFTAGRPYLENATVEAKLLEECRGPKILVFKMKPKKHYRRKRGHRWGLRLWHACTLSSHFTAHTCSPSAGPLPFERRPWRGHAARMTQSHVPAPRGV